LYGPFAKATGRRVACDLRDLVALKDPLEDSHVVTTTRNEILVVTAKLDTNHKGTVAEVDTVSLGLVRDGRVFEEADAAKVITRGDDGLVLCHGDIVQVCAVPLSLVASLHVPSGNERIAVPRGVIGIRDVWVEP